MGSGTDNIDELLETRSVFFTLQELANFYTAAAEEGAEVWVYDVTYGWCESDNSPHMLSDPKHWDVRKPKHWFDNIPEEGIICWVWDSHEVIKTLQVIHEFNPEGTWPFYDRGADCGWQYAQPVKPEECYQP